MSTTHKRPYFFCLPFVWYTKDYCCDTQTHTKIFFFSFRSCVCSPYDTAQQLHILYTQKTRWLHRSLGFYAGIPKWKTCQLNPFPLTPEVAVPAFSEPVAETTSAGEKNCEPQREERILLYCSATIVVKLWPSIKLLTITNLVQSLYPTDIHIK